MLRKPSRSSPPPPRYPSDRPLASPASGSYPRFSSFPPRHEDLSGASGAAVNFRPARFDVAAMPVHIACTFRCDGAVVGPIEVLDLSAAGFAALASPDLLLAPGSQLESFELLVAGRAAWVGEASVVHCADGRIGGRFTSAVLDVQQLRLGATLEGRLASGREQRARLPVEWRAAVADVRQMLEDVKFEVEEIERSETFDPLRRAEEEAELFTGLRRRWGSEYYEAVSRLHEMSKTLEPHAAVLGRTYASSMLMPLLAACPLHRRAYEKPLGYAGDFRMMELVFTEKLGGEGLFGRFLHSIGKNYTLARAVVGREVVVRQAIRAAAKRAGDGPVRVLALAAGPAVELRRFLHEIKELDRPMELILLDQDRLAHEAAHRQLTRVLLEEHKGMLPASVRCLHFSVRQLVRPQTEEEHRVVEDILGNLDLIYSVGLYDYLPERVAAALTLVLFRRLRAGGRMLLGNLVETPDSTWVMDYVWGWPLVYRTEADMLRLAKGLDLGAASWEIARDMTERCLFLDVTRRA